MTPQELSQVKLFIKEKQPTANELKSEIQRMALDNVIRVKRGVIQAFTGFGKMYMGATLIRRFRKISNGEVHIVVPTDSIKEGWEKTLREHNLEANVKVYIINTYTMSEKVVRMCAMQIVDEIHTCLGSQAEYFNTVLDTIADYQIGLTATLEEKHIQFLESRGLRIEFSIDVEEGLELGIVPQFKIYNVVLPLTPEEQQRYYKMDTLYREQAEWFKQLTPDWFDLAMYLSAKEGKKRMKFKDLTEIPSSVADTLSSVELFTGEHRKKIVERAVIFRQAVNKRISIVADSQYKNLAIRNILDLISTPKLVFESSIESVRKLQNDRPNLVAMYHSKMTDKQKENSMRLFAQNVFNALCSIKGLDAGTDLPKLSLAINKHYTSKELSFIQRLGRILRIDVTDVNKLPVMINLCSEPYIHKVNEYESVEVVPQDYKTIHRITKHKMFVKTIKPVEIRNIPNLTFTDVREPLQKNHLSK